MNLKQTLMHSLSFDTAPFVKEIDMLARLKGLGLPEGPTMVLFETYGEKVNPLIKEIAPQIDEIFNLELEVF